MNLYHLRYFVTLAHLEHYTQAAERLSITQPSLSHAISALEKELGVKLFEKDGRNIVLTRCGKAFLADVEQSLHMLDSSVNKLQLTGIGEGRIDLVQIRAVSTVIVPSLVKGFLQKTNHNNVDFHFHSSTGMTPDMIQGLKDRKYDIAFCSYMENEPLIDFVPIARQELVLIVPEGHPLENEKSIDLKDTLAYTQIGFSKRSGLNPIIRKLFEKCGGYPHIAYTVEEDQSVAGLVGAGFGIAIVPNMPILEYLPVKIIPILKPSWERIFYMATLKNVYHPPLIHAFTSYAREVSENNFPTALL